MFPGISGWRNRIGTSCERTRGEPKAQSDFSEPERGFVFDLSFTQVSSGSRRGGLSRPGSEVVVVSSTPEFNSKLGLAEGSTCGMLPATLMVTITGTSFLTFLFVNSGQGGERP